MFNALKYTKELEDVGFSREQAEATLNVLFGFAESNLATKEDVLRLKHSIENVEYRLTVRMGAMLAVSVGLIVTLQKLI